MAAVLAAGCDSGNSINEDECIGMSGRYALEAFEFDPEAGRFDPVNLLDTLDTGRTEVLLLNNCDFSFTYAFKNTTQDALITGRYTASSTMVRLDAKSEDAAELSRLYLDRRLLLQRGQGGVLVGDYPKTVRLSDIEDGYEGIPPVDGFIRLRLAKQ